MREQDTIVVYAKREYLKDIRYALIVIKAWIGVRLMKSVAQMLYEYKAHDIRKLTRLLQKKQYDEIENILCLPKGTIRLYDREYKNFQKTLNL